MKTILITGSTGVLGSAIARALAEDGFNLVLHTNSKPDQVEGLAHELSKKSVVVDTIKFDLENPDDISAALDRKSKSNLFSSMYGLVNNAGITKDNLSILMTDNDFISVIKVNLIGAFCVSRWVGRQLIKNRMGSIVNISSISGQIGRLGQVNYSSAKAGLHGLTKTMAEELGPRNIRVNALSVGLINSTMTSAIKDLDKIKALIPLRRLGEPNEVAEATRFLISEKASYITGAVININGGLFRG